jgi:hypothetical protein
MIEVTASKQWIHCTSVEHPFISTGDALSNSQSQETHLLPLRPLPTDIKHVDAQLTHVEPGLRDTGRLGTRS